MLATDMDEVHQGKGFLDVLVQELLLVLTVHVLQVLGLSPLVIQDPLCLLGLKTQEQEVASILIDADLLHLSVQEVPQDAIQGDSMPFQEEDENHTLFPVLQEYPLIPWPSFSNSGYTSFQAIQSISKSFGF